jgi:hypothetical protein
MWVKKKKKTWTWPNPVLCSRVKKCKWGCLGASHEIMWGSGGIYPLILNIGARWSEGPTSRSGRLLLWKRSPPYQLHKNQGGPQGQYEHFWGQTYLLPLPRTELWFVGHAARSLVTILTELSRLQVQQNRLKLYIFCSLSNNTVGNSGYRALNDRTVSKYDWVTMQKEAVWPTLRYQSWIFWQQMRKSTRPAKTACILTNTRTGYLPNYMPEALLQESTSTVSCLTGLNSEFQQVN